MKKIFILFIMAIARILLSFRYKIVVKGKENLKKKYFNKKNGILFLPNHPALVDPIFVSIVLWSKFKVHPLVVEYVYRQPGINAIMKLIGALPIPNLDTSLNELKIQKSKKVIDTIIKGIKNKQNYILYPSGRLKHTGKEIVGGASAAHKIISECPDVNIVLIRTTGLWGSSFSRAYTGRSPDFKSTLLRNIKSLLKSFLFFIPKRKVLMEIEIAKKDFPKKKSRLEINKYLENWYNNYLVDNKRVLEEPLLKVSYSPFKEKVLKEKKKDSKIIKGKKEKYSSDIEKIVFKELERMQPDINITEEKSLSADLGLDSLDIAELITFLNMHFDIGDIHPEEIETVKDVLEVAAGRKSIKKAEMPEVSISWPEEENRPNVILPQGNTLVESLLLMCDRMKNSSALGDNMIGVLSYKKLKITALALSLEIKKMKGDHIGVMLPAMGGTYLVILACFLAGKTPVMLNWTLGPRYLKHMIDITKTGNVITSWKFLEKLSNIEFGDITKKMIFMEDLKKNISKTTKIKAALLSLKKTKSLLKKLKLNDVNENETAVILFTSGTEANPKGVPLSHKNILSNLREAMQKINLSNKDVMYGFLPPFHSFGFSVAGLFPLLCGLKVAYFPDPTDSYSIVEGIGRWKVSIFCAAPSFLKGILQAGTKDHFTHMRYFVTGAEKAPKEIFEKAQALNSQAKVIEGYGITECSPILSLTDENMEPVGVGQLLPGIELITINPESLEKNESNNIEGELCVRGPNIFSGYLDKNKNPFITIDDKKWYRTGDLGYLDKNRNIILSGRLKRFTKIGGEMISLGGLEEIISNNLLLDIKDIKEDTGPLLALIALEKNGGKTELVLFSKVKIDKLEINKMLKDLGFSRLIKINEVRKIDEIPLLGTGKTDYRYLQKIVE